MRQIYRGLVVLLRAQQNNFIDKTGNKMFHIASPSVKNGVIKLLNWHKYLFYSSTNMSRVSSQMSVSHIVGDIMGQWV